MTLNDLTETVKVTQTLLCSFIYSVYATILNTDTRKVETTFRRHSRSLTTVSDSTVETLFNLQ